MDVEIDDRGAFDAVFALGVTGGDRGIVEEAEAHRLADFGMMAGRAHRDEGVVMLTCHHGVGRGDRAADAAHHGFPGARRHRGVAVDIDQAAGRCDVAEFADIMLAVAERDGIEAAFRRLAAHQRLEAVFAQHLGDRAQPVGSFRVPRGRQMVETGGMRQKQRHAKSWRISIALCGKGLI